MCVFSPMKTPGSIAQCAPMMALPPSSTSEATKFSCLADGSRPTKDCAEERISLLISRKCGVTRSISHAKLSRRCSGRQMIAKTGFSLLKVPPFSTTSFSLPSSPLFVAAVFQNCALHISGTMSFFNDKKLFAPLLLLANDTFFKHFTNAAVEKQYTRTSLYRTLARTLPAESNADRLIFTVFSLSLEENTNLLIINFLLFLFLLVLLSSTSSLKPTYFAFFGARPYLASISSHALLSDIKTVNDASRRRCAVAISSSGTSNTVL